MFKRSTVKVYQCGYFGGYKLYNRVTYRLFGVVIWRHNR